MDNDTTQGTELDDDEFEDNVEADDYSSYHNDNFRLLEMIGKGAYGVVYRAIWHGTLIAAKVIEHDESIGKGLITKDDSFCPFERDDSIGDGA